MSLQHQAGASELRTYRFRDETDALLLVYPLSPGDEVEFNPNFPF
jgi:hypothetical protein